MTPTNTATITPTPTATVPGQPAPHISGKTLIHAYWEIRGGVPTVDGKYMPRQWANGVVINDGTWGDHQVTNFGSGQGCDIWDAPNAGSYRGQNSDTFIKINLNRAARVYVIWRLPLSQKPTWIDSSYTRGPDVTAKRLSNGANYTYYSFYKTVPAGDDYFGSSWSSNVTPHGGLDLPWFVFCESDNSATVTPSPAIAPNTQCPDWLHDQWMTTGPDGLQYRTWHPQIDETYWCYYGHDHGSNPALFDSNWHPTFGYVGHQAGMVENTWGYKVYVFDIGDYRYGIMVHQGTTGVARACQQFHEVQFNIKQISTGTMMLNLQWMGNFGAAVENDTLTRLTPDACPDQGTTHIGNGQRQLPVVNGGGAPGATKYEPWRLGCNYVVTGCKSNDFIVNAPGAVTACLDINCNTGVALNQSGTIRFVTMNSSHFGYNAAMGPTGHFCTDPMGEMFMNCSDPTAIAQYVAPGFDIIHNSLPHYSDVWRWGGMYEGNANTGFDSEVENSVPAGNNN